MESQAAWRELARGARLRGKQVYVLPPEAYGGEKDASAAWEAGTLHIGEIPKPAADPAHGDGWHLIESETLGERVAIAESEEAAARVPGGYVVYTADELDLLKGCDEEALRFLHSVKKLIDGRIAETFETSDERAG